LVVLLVSLPLLALMQWQWHQLMQTLWLFTRPAALVEQTLPLTQAQAAESRLNLGLPLLLLQPLAVEATAAQQNTPTTPEPAPEPAPQPAPEAITTVAEEPEPEPSATADADADSGDLVVDAGVAVTPEEPAEEHESTQLDTKVAEGDGLPS